MFVTLLPNVRLVRAVPRNALAPIVVTLLPIVTSVNLSALANAVEITVNEVVSCVITDNEASQGSFSVGYETTFETVGTNVTISIELLDTDNSGVWANAVGTRFPVDSTLCAVQHWWVVTWRSSSAQHCEGLHC